MSCYICGRHIEQVRIDPRDMKIRPCLTCEGIISETAGEKVRERREEMDEEFSHLSLPEYLEGKRTYDVDG